MDHHLNFKVLNSTNWQHLNTCVLNCSISFFFKTRNNIIHICLNMLKLTAIFQGLMFGDLGVLSSNLYMVCHYGSQIPPRYSYKANIKPKEDFLLFLIDHLLKYWNDNSMLFRI